MKTLTCLTLAVGMLVGCQEPPTPAKVEASAPKPTVAKVEKPSKDRLYPLDTLQKVILTLPKGKVEAYVMDDDSKRQEGMMLLTEGEVKPNEGMLFVFPDSAPRAFWMENTLMPLDIIYIREDGVVDSMVQGKRLDRTSLPSTGPAMYVLELPLGQAKTYGVTVGSRIGGVQAVKTVR